MRGSQLNITSNKEICETTIFTGYMREIYFAIYNILQVQFNRRGIWAKAYDSLTKSALFVHVLIGMNVSFGERWRKYVIVVQNRHWINSIARKVNIFHRFVKHNFPRTFKGLPAILSCKLYYLFDYRFSLLSRNFSCHHEDHPHSTPPPPSQPNILYKIDEVLHRATPNFVL